MENKKIWAILMHLSNSEWTPKKETIEFDDNYWNDFLEECVQSGVNMVMLDIGDGVKYESYPEISAANAWSADKIRAEVEKCKKMGIELIPKLNFSSGHNFWMGKYRFYTCTPEYYEFCSKIIKEVCDMFGGPRYFHLGMDEENIVTCSVTDYVMYRTGERLIKDLKFYMDEVKKNGATPMIWHEPLVDYPELYKKYISPEDAIIMPWWYWAYDRSELFPLITDFEDNYRKRGIVWEQDVPMRKVFIETILPLMKDGYKYMPCASNFYEYADTMKDTVAYFKNGAPSEDQLIGYMTAPWKKTIYDDKEAMTESLAQLKEAKELYY